MYPLHFLSIYHIFSKNLALFCFFYDIASTNPLVSPIIDHSILAYFLPLRGPRVIAGVSRETLLLTTA